MISTIVPAPPDRGDRIRGYEMLRALVEFGEVQLALIGNEPLGTAASLALESIGVHVLRFPISTVLGLRGVLGAVVAGRPWGVWRLRRTASRLASAVGPQDAVIGFQLKSAYYAEKVPAGLKVLELTDSLGRYRKVLPVWRNPLRWLSLTGAGREEAVWAGRFPMTFVCSEQDAKEIAKHSPHARIRVVDNGADPRQTPLETGTKDSLLFVGSLFYPPNRDGLHWFLRDVWPAIAADHPTLAFRIVGEGPNDTVRRLAGQRVTWTGYLNDLTWEYERALALVNPVRYGTGTRRKILYAWAAGLPVISTREGANGLAYDAGKHLLIANQPEEFRHAVSKLLSEPGTWERIGGAGWALTRQRYHSAEIWHAALTEMFTTRTRQ